MEPSVMIGETVKKDVVYSAECFDQQPLDSNTQLIVEYSIMALEARYMEPGDQHDTIRKIDGSIDLINGVLKIGSFVFPPAAPVLLFIAGVGSGIQWLMGLIPDNRPDPVLEKFKELEKAVQELENRMDVHFADMQSFMTEHNFNLNIATQASTLMMYMRNCLKYQDKSDVEDFQREYKKNNPLSAVYFMKTLLDNRQTNPLIMGLNGEKGKTKATYNKWKNIITSILGEYLLIEAFASGLLGLGEFSQERILQQWHTLEKSFKEWEDEFKNDEGYWEKLKDEFPTMLESMKDLNNAEKSQKIKERLEGYITNDSFFICVYNASKDYYLKATGKDQLIEAKGKGRCDAFVYRSRTASKMTEREYAMMEERFRYHADFWIHYDQDIFSRRLIRFPEGFGLTCRLDVQYNAQINLINNSEWHNRSPGQIDKIVPMDVVGHPKGEHWLLLGFD